MLNKINSSPVKERDVKARLSPELRILVALSGLHCWVASARQRSRSLSMSVYSPSGTI